MKRLVTAVVVALPISLFSIPSAGAGDRSLTIEIVNARNDGGVLLVCLWREEASEGFPRCGLESAAHRKTTAVSNGRGVVVFDGLTAGSYAVSVLHDEDGDGRMGRALLTPLEGLAVSQVDQLGMPPPDFHAAAFDLDSTRKITLSVQYW